MSTKQETVDFIVEQLVNVSGISVRKMFGEYALYVGAKVVGLICDDQLFIKYTIPGKEFAEGKYDTGFAYPGAKESMNVSEYIDDGVFLSALVAMTADALPMPKPKKKKKTT